ncbi:hypothetical protein [Streptomyces lasiicapitis]|nr:hypothetical protein [Streptomyces lasiicapitis]
MAAPETSSAAGTLVAGLDPLPYPERMRELARRGRELGRAGVARGVMAELEGGGVAGGGGPGADGSGGFRAPVGRGEPAPDLGNDPGGSRRWGFGRRGRAEPHGAQRGAPRPATPPFLPGRPYERGIAILLAALTRDTDWIAARLADPDAFVRGQALRAADTVRVPDAAFEAAFDDAPEAVRRQLCRAVVAGRRTALADRLVDGVRRDWGDAAAARLLPGCSEEVAARLLPELFHAVRGWSALAKPHGELLLDLVARQLAAAPEALRDACWEGCAGALEATADRAPERVLDLLERYAPTRFPPRLLPHLRPLATAGPARVLSLLTGPWGHQIRVSGHVTRSVLRALARSGDPDATAGIHAYARSVGDDSSALGRLLAAHPPAGRAAVFAAGREGRGTPPATVDGAVLDALPRRAAADEGRRVAAATRASGAYWITVLAAESYLPCAEARDALVAATRRPAADDRADAWPFLILNVARFGDRAEAVRLLDDMAARLTNEQDLVRSEALLSLSRVRPALFTEAAAPYLDKLVADALAARDCSRDSRDALSSLAVAVLREHAASGQRALVGWSLRTLTRISGSTRRVDLGRLDRTLRRGQEHEVYEALRPWIEAGAEKADYSLAFTLARAVGRRAHGMAALQELLWQAVRFGDNPTVSTAIGLWLDAPATRDERVAHVLAQEPSAAVLHPVHSVLTSRRTDLLDRLLGGAPPYGRFLAAGSAWTVPAGPAQVRRWVPRQQQAWLRQLEWAARDTGQPQADRAAAVARCADVPGAGPDLVRHWAADPEIRFAEAALGALARTDRPGDAVPELLAHAGGERARVAVYAATRASRYAPPSRLAPWLRDVLTGPGAKVTSRKEAARLAATRLPAARAAVLLREAYDAPGAHRDVRAACVAFAGGLLGEEAVWHLLADAAHPAHGEQVLRTAVLALRPLDMAPAHRRRYAHLVQEVSATDDAETAALAFQTLPRWSPWAPEAVEVLGAACVDLTRGRVVWRAAARGLVTAAVSTEGGGAGLCGALGELVRVAERELDGSSAGVGAGPAGAGEVSAGPGEVRDLPARRRVEFVVEQLVGERGVTARAVCLRAGELLAEGVGFVPQAARLLVAALSFDGDRDGDRDGRRDPDLGAALSRLAELHRDRPALAPMTCRNLAERLRAAPAESGDALLPAARHLTASGTPTEGLLALTLTTAEGTRLSWPSQWRTLLNTLRDHPSPDVRDGALAVSLTPQD